MGAFVVFGCLAILMEILVRTLRFFAKEDHAVFEKIDGPPVWRQILGKRDRRLFWFILRGKFLRLESIRLRVLCGAILGVGLMQLVVGTLFVLGIFGVL